MRLWFLFIVILFGFLPLSNSLYGQDFKNEKQLIKGANDAFDNGDYKAATRLYSTLVSNYPKDPEYNFKYGASLLYSGSDKEKPIKYLQFAVSKPDVDPLAYFYYAQGLHLNYEFKKAIKYYRKFQTKGKDADVKKFEVENAIVQCENGTTLLKTITDLIVLDKKDLNQADFYKVYDLSEFGGQILVKIEDFQSDYEKKNGVKDIMYFPKNAEKIFFTRQNSADGNKDIYYKIRNPDGTWSRSISMGKPVNTKFDEDYPFMHPDGTSLYFASKGHNSLGGYDIFVTNLDAQGNWTEPKNLDFAINTPADDYLFITDRKGETAYFTSNRATPLGEVSVYKINMERVPLDFAFVYGSFTSDKTNKAHIKVVDAETQVIIGEYDTDEEGKYKIKLPNEGKFNFIVDYENSTVAHSGTVEIQSRDAFKPLKQTMEVLNQGQPDEKLVIKNLVDEEVDEDVELTADYLKKKAKLTINKDKFKDRKKKPELQSEEKELAENVKPEFQKETIANTKPVDVGKAATSIASEEKITESVENSGPTLDQSVENTEASNSSNNRANNGVGNTSSGNSNGNSLKESNSSNPSSTNGGNVSVTKASNAGSAALGATANAIGAGAPGAVVAKKMTLDGDNGSKDEILEVTSNNKEALENDEKVYQKQAEISRSLASISTSQATQKRAEAEKKMLAANSSEATNIESSPEYIEAKKLNDEADVLDRKAKTSEEITAQLQQNEQRSKDLQLLSNTYESQIENQSDEGVNNATYDEYEEKLGENLSKQASLSDLQQKYSSEYDQKSIEARNQKAKTDAMHEEVLEIEADIKNKESKLAKAKGKEKKALEEEITADKADLITEKQTFNSEDEKTKKLLKEVSLIGADVAAVNEVIAKSNEDVEISKWTAEASNVEKVEPNDNFVSSVSNEELAQVVENPSSTSQNESNIPELGNSNSGSANTNNNSSNSTGDELGGNTGLANNSLQNENGNSTSTNSTTGNSGEGSTTSTKGGKSEVIGNSAESVNSSGEDKEMEVVKSSSTSNTSKGNGDDSNITSPPKQGAPTSKSRNANGNYVPSAAGAAVGSAVAASTAAWKPEDINTNEVFDIDESTDLTANEIAILPDSNSEKVSAFEMEEINDQLTKSDQSLGAINKSSYHKKYNDQFLDLIEDDGTEYEKAVKTYVINESRMLDIEKEISYLEAIEGEVPEEYQDNLSERLSNLEDLRNTVFKNTENSKQRVLDMAQSQGTSDDLASITNESRKELNTKVDPVLAAAARKESEVEENETEAIEEITSSQNNENLAQNSTLEQDEEDNLTSSNENNSNDNAETTDSENVPNSNNDNSSNSNSDSPTISPNEAGETIGNAASTSTTNLAGAAGEAASMNNTNNNNSSVNSEGSNSTTESNGENNNSDSFSESNTTGESTTGESTTGNSSTDNGSANLASENNTGNDNNENLGENNSAAESTNQENSNAAENQNSNSTITSGNGEDETTVSNENKDSIANESENGNDNTTDAIASNEDSNSNRNTEDSGVNSLNRNQGEQLSSGQEDASSNSSENSNSDNLASTSEKGNQVETYTENNSVANSGEVTNTSSIEANEGAENGSSEKGNTGKTGGTKESKTEIVPGENSDRLAKVFDAPEKSMNEVVGSKTEKAIKEKEVVSAEVTEMETELANNESKLESAKRKERKTLGPQVEQQKQDVADAKNQEEIANYRIAALARAADNIIALEQGEEKESEKEVKRAESLKVEAEEKFTAADTREGEKVRGKKNKKAKAVEVRNLKGEGERKLAQSTASEKLAVELAELEEEVIFTYKNTPETLPVSNKILSQAEVNDVENSEAFAQYDATRKEAAGYYKKAQVAYVNAEKLENENKTKKAEIINLNSQLDAEGDVDKISKLQESIKELQDAIVVNEENAAAYKTESKNWYSEYNHTNNQAVRMIKSQEPQLQENLVAHANQLENEGRYAVAPIEGSSLAEEDPAGYSPDAFTRVVRGIDDYPAELTDAIFDMMDFNKSLYNSDNPIPVDTKLPGGVVYKVQIGAFRQPPPDDVFKGFAPVRGENTRPGWVRYTAGLFNAKDQAKLKRNEIRALGYADAFVVAYKDGKRISLSEAEKLIAEGYSAPASYSSAKQTASSSTNQPISAPGEVIPVSEIKGLLYTIQVGAFRNKVTAGSLFGITPLIEYQQSGLFKYGSGVYNDKQKAENAKARVLAAGVSDAFVTAFFNGKRISIGEADNLAKQGPGVFAKEAPVSINSGSAVGNSSIVFRVQVGAYRQEVPLEDAKIILSLSNLGLDVQQNAEMTTYTVGRYATYNEAKQVQDRVKGQGLNGAFVVAYENGKRIEVQEAIQKLGQ